MSWLGLFWRRIPYKCAKCVGPFVKVLFEEFAGGTFVFC